MTGQTRSISTESLNVVYEQTGPDSGQAVLLLHGFPAALGKDVIDLLDVLGIQKAILAGYDWGGRAACVAAALRSSRP